MKTAAWYANQILTNSGDISDVDMFENAIEWVESIRREQHEATCKAFGFDEWSGVNIPTFESTQED